MAYRRRGVGDVAGGTAAVIGWGVDASTPSVNADFPWYCDYGLFTEHLPACQVPTAAVQNAAIARDIEKASAGDVALAQQEYQQYLADVAALAKIDPEGAAQYTFAGAHPHEAAVLGAGPFGRMVGGTVNLASDVNNWAGVPVWVWLAGGLGLFAFVAIGGGKSRRYGR